MASTITISESAYKELLTRLSRVEKMLITLTEKFNQEPSEGSEEWWNWAHKKGIDAKKRGEYTRIKSKKELVTYFKNL